MRHSHHFVLVLVRGSGSRHFRHCCCPFSTFPFNIIIMVANKVFNRPCRVISISACIILSLSFTLSLLLFIYSLSLCFVLSLTAIFWNTNKHTLNGLLLVQTMEINTLMVRSIHTFNTNRLTWFIFCFLLSLLSSLSLSLLCWMQILCATCLILSLLSIHAHT